MMAPQTLEEWESYIESLSDADLLIQSRAANTLEFVRKMAREGLDPQTISDIFEKFAITLYERDMLVPERGEGTYLSYRALLRDLNQD